MVIFKKNEKLCICHPSKVNIIKCTTDEFSDETDVKSMDIDPIQEEYNPGDTITCVAKGNPEPTLKWVDQNNATITDSGMLEIDAAMEGRQTYSCLAQNEVRGETILAMVTITFNGTSKFIILSGQNSFRLNCDGNVMI